MTAAELCAAHIRQSESFALREVVIIATDRRFGVWQQEEPQAVI